jgi:hypothetical protein
MEVNNMKKATFVAFCLMLVLAFAVSSSFAGEAKGEKVTVEGNVICLIPDYGKGTVNPVIANGPCNNVPAHQHLLVTKDGKVYTLQGLQEGLMAIAANPNHTAVKITGVATENPGGWVLTVE